MTFADILADVYRRTGFAASPATEVVTRIKAFVNETQADIMAEPGMMWLLNDQITIASVATQAEYGMPQTAQRIKVIRDITNRRPLMPMSLSTYRNRFPSPATDSGVPEYYVDLGQASVTLQPLVASQIDVVSSSASDTGVVTIEGFRDLIPFTATATLTGATPVNIGGTDTTRITKFYSASVAVGSIVLRRPGSNIGTIVPGATAPHLRMIALVPTPVSAITYTIDYERTVTDMTGDKDEPLIPVQFHRLLASGARAKEYEKQNQGQRLAVARADYILGLNQLKYYVYTQVVGSPNLRSNAARRSIASAVNVATS